MSKPTHITLILPSLRGGGAERVASNLAKGFLARGIHVEMLLLQEKGAMFNQLDNAVQVTFYDRPRVLRSLFDLRDYFVQNKPDVVISFLNQTNLVTLLAHKLASSQIPLLLTVHSDISRNIQDSLKERIIIYLSSLFTHRAARIIGVSDGVTDSIRRHLKTNNAETIYNPIDFETIEQKSQGKSPHPWFGQNETPVIVSAGRFVTAKGFDTLIRAFHKLRSKLSAKLIILGEGSLRPDLEALIAEFGLQDDVDLPGYVDNPYIYFSHADLFVMSSRYEGLPSVLIEAMACGLPVIATDCKSGPREILLDGELAPLVPVDDPSAFAEAMARALTEKSINTQATKARAQDFSIENSVDHFLRIIADVQQG